MTDGVVRKMFVCFFDEGRHAHRTPVERVAIDIKMDQAPARDGRRDQDQDQRGRLRDEDRFLDQTSLQVSRYRSHCKTSSTVGINVTGSRNGVPA